MRWVAWLLVPTSLNAYGASVSLAQAQVARDPIVDVSAHANASANASTAPLELRTVDDVALALAHEAREARTWRVTWTAINSGLTLLTFAGLFVLPTTQRADLLVGGLASLLSTGVTWWWALDVESDALEAAQVARLPPRLRAAKMQYLFEHSAQDEAARITWPWHVGNFLSALVPAAISWFWFQHRQEALLSLVSGFALGEVELLTQPTGLLRWQRRPGARLRVALEPRGALFMCEVAF